MKNLGHNKKRKNDLYRYQFFGGHQFINVDHTF